MTSVKHRPRLHEFLFDLANEIQSATDLGKGFRILKAVLHALRDSIHVESAIQAQSCLPDFLIPVFQEGWKPFEEKHALGANQDFIKEVCIHEGKMNHYDLPERVAAERVRAVFRVIEKYVGPKKLPYLKEVYPNELKYILKQDSGDE